MSNLSIEVEPFAGVSIEDACHDAMVVADILGIVVMFNFNGVRCMARPGDSVESLEEDWNRIMQKKDRGPNEIAVGVKA